MTELTLRTGEGVLARVVLVQRGSAPAADDPPIGMMDSAELARLVVTAFNAAVAMAAALAGDDLAAL